ncbi:hypothetical protein BaRGS_00032343 [Batillaria attramentaria]|uniref:Uncharacterized protein n=1 Tax=Batillaria attramentaria TaxID=370345 RepID=A0ABD0JNQ6_9CAEN
MPAPHAIVKLARHGGAILARPWKVIRQLWRPRVLWQKHEEAAVFVGFEQPETADQTEQKKAFMEDTDRNRNLLM